MKVELISILLISIILDRVFGEPPDSIHPTVYIGSLITFLDKHIRSGILVFMIVSFGSSFLAFFILGFFSGNVLLLFSSLILKITYSWRGMKDYTLPIAKALERNDLASARKGIPFIAGRDPTNLSEQEIASTTVESIAESSVDGVISPLFYFLFFSFIDIQIGIASAVFYRAANTLDSMLGQPSNPKGRFPAKFDEILNFIPSRVGAFFLLLSGVLLKGNFKQGLKTFKSERNKTPSKNSGQTISAMAGLISVKLEKRGAYSIGVENEILSTQHIYAALKIFNLQVILFIVLMVMFWIF